MHQFATAGLHKVSFIESQILPAELVSGVAPKWTFFVFILISFLILWFTKLNINKVLVPTDTKDKENIYNHLEKYMIIYCMLGAMLNHLSYHLTPILVHFFGYERVNDLSKSPSWKTRYEFRFEIQVYLYPGILLLTFRFHHLPRKWKLSVESPKTFKYRKYFWVCNQSLWDHTINSVR